jgi:UDP-GlcNAc:undecaprenyl-phosphate GlcNAc-1-phosphate transferase
MQYKVTAVLGVVLAIAVLRTVAHRAGLIDHPGGRRQHANPVPLVGGLAIGIGLALALAARGTLTPAPAALLASALVVIAGGVIDDRIELSARIKLLLQLVAASVLVDYGGTVLFHLGALLSPAVLSLGATFAVPFTILGVVGVMNAMNMIDGADGLAGGITLSALLWFGLAAWMAGMPAHASLIGLFACAVATYLLFNAGGPLARRFKVFLGDAGSMLLGLILAWIAIELTMSPFAPLKPVTAVWILAVPICDSVSLMLRRMLRRRSPFSPDREHFHHLLQDAGASSGRAVVLMLLISFTFGGFALFAEKAGVPEYVMFYLSMVIFAGYTCYSSRFFSRQHVRAPRAAA